MNHLLKDNVVISLYKATKTCVITKLLPPKAPHKYLFSVQQTDDKPGSLPSLPPHKLDKYTPSYIRTYSSHKYRHTHIYVCIYIHTYKTQ